MKLAILLLPFAVCMFKRLSFLNKKNPNQPQTVESTASGSSPDEQRLLQLQKAFLVAPDDSTRDFIKLESQKIKNRMSSQSFANPTLIDTPSGMRREPQQLEQLKKALSFAQDEPMKQQLREEIDRKERSMRAQGYFDNLPSTSLTPDMTARNARPPSIVSAGSSRRSSISPVRQSPQNPNDEAAAIMGDPSLSEQQKNERLSLLFSQAESSQGGPSVRRSNRVSKFQMSEPQNPDDDEEDETPLLKPKDKRRQMQ